jgi:hypothetical protein
MFHKPGYDPDDLRRQVRSAVHENRNLAAAALYEGRKAQKDTMQAKAAAHDAIARLEEAKRMRVDAGRH